MGGLVGSFWSAIIQIYAPGRAFVGELDSRTNLWQTAIQGRHQKGAPGKDAPGPTRRHSQSGRSAERKRFHGTREWWITILPIRIVRRGAPENYGKPQSSRALADTHVEPPSTICRSVSSYHGDRTCEKEGREEEGRKGGRNDTPFHSMPFRTHPFHSIQILIGKPWKRLKADT